MSSHRMAEEAHLFLVCVDRLSRLFRWMKISNERMKIHSNICTFFNSVCWTPHVVRFLQLNRGGNEIF